MNKKIEKTWKDNFLIQIDDADGIGKTLVKVYFSSDFYNNPSCVMLTYNLLGP